MGLVMRCGKERYNRMATVMMSGKSREYAATLFLLPPTLVMSAICNSPQVWQTILSYWSNNNSIFICTWDF
ncbi:hypothetical protein SLEP1_g27105 [Rubroshorea leprosula]|uniref:Uncharacterized protein n=1 Tax=Rubroshorea leprosula TaxID=152421 RepID=A0AAV5K1W4_9ROSI|nr:hypothetical protein SLEP1_g27105 [Rubroshorea leprosula]